MPPARPGAIVRWCLREAAKGRAIAQVVSGLDLHDGPRQSAEIEHEVDGFDEGFLAAMAPASFQALQHQRIRVFKFRVCLAHLSGHGGTVAFRWRWGQRKYRGRRDRLFDLQHFGFGVPLERMLQLKGFESVVVGQLQRILIETSFDCCSQHRVVHPE